MKVLRSIASFVLFAIYVFSWILMIVPFAKGGWIFSRALEIEQQTTGAVFFDEFCLLAIAMLSFLLIDDLKKLERKEKLRKFAHLSASEKILNYDVWKEVQEIENS